MKSFTEFINNFNNGGWYIVVSFGKFERTFEIPFRDAKTEKLAEAKAKYLFIIEYGEQMMKLKGRAHAIYTAVMDQYNIETELTIKIERIRGTK